MENFPKPNIGQKVQENIKPETKQYRDGLAEDLKTLRKIDSEAARSYLESENNNRYDDDDEIKMVRNFEIALKNGEQDTFIENVLSSDKNIYHLGESIKSLEVFPDKLQKYFLDKKDYPTILNNSEKFKNLDFDKIGDALISRDQLYEIINNFEKFPKEIQEKALNLSLESDNVNAHISLVENIDKLENLSLVDLYQIFKQKGHLRVLALKADSFPEQDVDYLYNNLIKIEDSNGLNKLPFIFEENLDLFIEKVDNNKIINDVINLGKADLLLPILHKFKGFDFKRVANSYVEVLIGNNTSEFQKDENELHLVNLFREQQVYNQNRDKLIDLNEELDNLIDKNIEIYIKESGKESVVAGLTALGKTDYILKYSNILN